MPRSSEEGFTLVEVLVALVVSALLLVAIFHASGLALTRLRTVEERRIALLQGSYLLAKATVGDFTGAVRTGAVDNMHWTSDEKPVSLDPRRLLVLARIRITVTGRDGTILFDQSAERLKALPR